MGILHVGDKLYKREGSRIRVFEILAYNKHVKPVELYLKSGNRMPKIYPVTEIGKTLFLSIDEVPPPSNSKARKKQKVIDGLWSDNLGSRYPTPESEKYEKVPSASHFKLPKTTSEQKNSFKDPGRRTKPSRSVSVKVNPDAKPLPQEKYAPGFEYDGKSLQKEDDWSKRKKKK